jgi:hypothetical protein
MLPLVKSSNGEKSDRCAYRSRKGSTATAERILIVETLNQAKLIIEIQENFNPCPLDHLRSAAEIDTKIGSLKK